MRHSFSNMQDKAVNKNKENFATNLNALLEVTVKEPFLKRYI